MVLLVSTGTFPERKPSQARTQCPAAIGCHNGVTEDNAWRRFAARKRVRICEEDHLVLAYVSTATYPARKPRQARTQCLAAIGTHNGETEDTAWRRFAAGRRSCTSESGHLARQPRGSSNRTARPPSSLRRGTAHDDGTFARHVPRDLRRDHTVRTGRTPKCRRANPKAGPTTPRTRMCACGYSLGPRSTTRRAVPRSA